MLNKITLILLSVIFIFNIQITNAQFPDPKDPCYAMWPNYGYTNVGNPMYKTITLAECPNCVFFAEYYYRTFTIGTETINDVNITQVFSMGSGCDDCTAKYKDIFQALLRQIFNDNSMGFYKDLVSEPWDPDHCNTDWAATAASCVWRWHEQPRDAHYDDDFFGGVAGIVKKSEDPNKLAKKTSNDKLQTGGYTWKVMVCDESSCCRASYKLCWNTDGVLQSVETTVMDNDPSCSVTDCYPGCDNLNMAWSVGVGKESSDAKLSNNKATIKPNPAQNEFEININSSYSGMLKIEVSDLEGNIVETLTEIKKQDTFSKTISSKDFSNGLYIIKIHYIDSGVFDSYNVIIHN
jgi:hypothetical protein